MSLFGSNRERKLWILTATLVVTIYSTLGLTRRMAWALRDQDLITITFVIGMALVAATIVAHAVRRGAGRAEMMVWLGIAAVYVMLFTRMGLVEERTHLIEYSVVAIFVFEALTERNRHTAHRRPGVVASQALVITGIVGWIDEGIQAIMPTRVYDIQDVGFNVGAAFVAIGGSLALRWAAQRVAAQR